MIIINSLEHAPQMKKPIALTKGMFDGVHIGHRYLLRETKKIGTPVVITFANHPAELLYGKTIPLLSTLDEKLTLFATCGVQLAIVLQFTEALAQQTYSHFLTTVHRYVPFSHLVLGEGDRFGKDREGTPANVQEIAKKLGFKAVYLPKLQVEGAPVSSQRIRQLKEQGETQLAAKLQGTL